MSDVVGCAQQHGAAKLTNGSNHEGLDHLRKPSTRALSSHPSCEIEHQTRVATRTDYCGLKEGLRRSGQAGRRTAKQQRRHVSLEQALLVAPASSHKGQGTQ